MRSWVLALLVLVVGLLATTQGYAQEGNNGSTSATGNDKAAADVLFEQGRALLDAGKVDEACPKFAESNRLDPGIGTMLFLAECWQRAGKTASAWEQFREAEALAAKQGDKREKVAHDRAQTLAASLATLTIRVSSSSSSSSSGSAVVVTRDGREVGSPLWGTKTPIDPGEHTVQASAKGFTSWEKRVVVRAAENVQVDVPPLVKAPDSGGEQPSDPVLTPRRTWQKPLAIGLAVVGVASVTIGSAFGLSAIAKNDRADARCTDQACSADSVALGDKANEHGNIATVGIALGVALIAGGAVLFFTAPSNSTASASRSGSRQRRSPLTFTF